MSTGPEASRARPSDPVPTVEVALVADAHLGGPGGPAEPLIAQFEQLFARGCRRLVLLGDLFHVWIGARRYETSEIEAVVSCLRALRARGLWIGYVEGNRDFFLESSPYRDLFDEYGLELVVELDGRRCLCVHGDGLNERDVRYRFWRRLSKSAPSRALFRRFPGMIARRLVERTERRLARSNFRHKRLIPEGVILDFASRRLEEGYDLVVLGHFHEPRRWVLSNGVVQILDAWYHRRQVYSLGALIGQRAAVEGGG